MARHWVQESPADARRTTWSTLPSAEALEAGAEDGPDAEIRPIVPAARRPAPAEVRASEAASA